MAPLVSVILPVYNQAPYLGWAIDSILSQSFSDLELLIFDDGSTDGSADIIRNYAAKDARIVAGYGANKGRAQTTNQLAADARGTFTALMDADDVMMPGRLERQVAFLRTNPQVTACSCHSLYIDSQGQVLGKLTYPFLKNEAESVRATKEQQIVLCSLTGLLIRTKEFKEKGGLDGRFWPADDFEFINRLVQQGCIVVNLQAVLMQYRVHGASATGTDLEHIYYKGQYARTCYYLRAKNESEPSFEAYMEAKQKAPISQQRKLRKHIRSIQLFQYAGFALYRKRYFRFLGLSVKASILSPAYLFSKLGKLKTAF